MQLNVRLIGDPVLRKVCDTLHTLEGIDALLEEMHRAMVSEQGIGLAANQVGHSVRVFILKDGDSFKEFINPEVITQSELVDFENEGCLSIPGAFANTKRFKHVRLKWIDRQGRTQEEDFLDTQAFAIQHEMDHLNGKLYVDQFGPLKREMVVKKHKKFLKLRSK